MTHERYSDGEWTAKHVSHVEVVEGVARPTGDMKRVIHAISTDDQGRRCTRFLAEVFEQAGKPGMGEANAHMMAASKRLFEACQYTLGHLLDDPKYQRDDALWSCVSHLVNAISMAKGKV
jgi:hypothetical protein